MRLCMFWSHNAIAGGNVTQYRHRVLEIVRGLVEPLGTIETALDFGSGDGFLRLNGARRNIKSVTAVDVVERGTSLWRPFFTMVSDYLFWIVPSILRMPSMCSTIPMTRSRHSPISHDAPVSIC